VPSSGLAIRWVTRWWDPALGRFGAPGQDIAVYADGTVVGASTVDAAARPMVWPYLTGTIPVGEVAALLAAAADAGLLEPAEPADGNPNVVGAPVSFVELHTAGAMSTHRVHALATPPNPDTEYLAALRGFVDRLQNVTRAALDPSSAAYAEPAHVAVTATPVEPSAARAVTEWTGALDLAAASGCAVADDATTIALLRTHLSGDHFSQGDSTYAVTAHQLIPGETTCFGEPTGEPAEAAEAVRVTVQPLFPVVPPFVPSGPDVVVYADGTVLTFFHGVFDTRPMVWPYQQGSIDASAVGDLLAAAADAGLLGPGEVQLPSLHVADAPLTTVVVTTAEGRFVHRASALSSPAADESDYVARLREFVGRATSVARAATAGGAMYEPAAVALSAAPHQPEPGQPAAVAWPGGVALADAPGCIVTGDPATVAELVGQHDGQYYTDGGVTYQVAARVAFPGDTTC